MQQQPTPKSPWLRFIFCAILFAVYMITSGPVNISNAVIFVVSLLGVSIFEPVYTMIGSWIHKLVHFIGHPFRRPAVQPAQAAAAQPAQTATARPRRIYAIITPILVAIIIFMLVYNPLKTFITNTESHQCIYEAFNIPKICGTGIGVEPLPTSDGSNIGLINGTDDSPFDLSQMNSPEKQVEKLIFNENKQYCSQTHITLALVTMLSRTVDDTTLSANVGLEDLQGAYLAQKEYNQTSSIKICFVIANVGTGSPEEQQQAVSQVLNQLVVFSKYDSTFRGIVGFPYSQTAKDAFNKYDQFNNWKQTPIPIISPSATTNQLNTQPNFYRVVSSDQIQTEAMVEFLEQRFHTKQRAAPTQIAIFVDPNNAYSDSLYNSFISNIDTDKPNIAPPSVENYTVLDPSTLKAPIADALQKQVDFIFFAGYAYDLNALENQLHAQQQQQGVISKRIPILGGDGLYDLDRYVENPYSVVYSTVYASPLETHNGFVKEYTQVFGPLSAPSSSQDLYSYLPPHVILSHDAVKVAESVLDQIGGKDVPSQQTFNNKLEMVHSSGIGGSISFQQGSSNPLNKPVYILCTDSKGTLHLAADDIPGTTLKLDNANQCV